MGSRTVRTDVEPHETGHEVVEGYRVVVHLFTEVSRERLDEGVGRKHDLHELAYQVGVLDVGGRADEDDYEGDDVADGAGTLRLRQH